MKHKALLYRTLAVALVGLSVVAASHTARATLAESRAVTFPAAFKPSMLNNVAASRTAPVAFTASRDTDTVFAFDPRTGVGIGQLKVGDGPLAVTLLEQNGQRLLGVTCEGFYGAPLNLVALVDATNPADMRLVRTIDMPEGYIFLLGSRTLRFVAGGTALLVTATSEITARAFLISYDVATGAELSRADIGFAPGSIDVVESPERSVCAVQQSVAPRGRVTIVNISDLSALRVERVVRFPRKSGLYNVNNVILSADGRIGYVSSGDGNSVYAFEVDTGRLVSTTRTGSFPTFTRRFELDGRPHLLVVAENAADLYAYDVTDPAHPVLAWVFAAPSVFLDVEPAITADQTTVFAATTDGNKAYAVDMATGDLKYQAVIGERAVASDVWEGDGQRYPCFVGIVSADVTSFLDSSSGYLGRRFAGPGDALLFTLYQNIALTHDARYACVASKRTDEVLVIDVSSAAVVARVPVSDAPSKIAVAEDPSSGSLRVLVVGSRDGIVTIVNATDPANAFVEHQITLESAIPPFLEFANIAVSADGSTAYLADGNQFLYSIDVASGAVVGSIGTGFFPVTIALHEDRGRRTIAVLNTMYESTSVAVVDATNPAAMSLVTSANIPKSQVVALNNVPQFTDDGRFVLVGASITESFFSIDALTGQIAGTLENTSAVVPAPYAVDNVQRFAVVNLGDTPGKLYRLARSGAPRKAISFENPAGGYFLVGNDPVVSPDGTAAVVPNYGGASVLAFDPSTGQSTGEMAMGDGPATVAVDWASGTVVALDVNGTASSVVIRNLSDLAAPSDKSPDRAPRSVRTSAGARGVVSVGDVDAHDSRSRPAFVFDSVRGRIRSWDRQLNRE